MFREVKVEDAIGLPLAHDLTQILPGEFKGRKFQAGHVITQGDIPALLDIGKRHIYILDLAEGFLHENEGAARMARAIAGENVYFTGPAEGKMTLKASTDGLLKVRDHAIHQMNEIEGIAVSTLVTNRPVKRNQPLAGVRPIPLVIEEAKIKQLETIAADAPVMYIKPFQHKKVAIITTGSEVYTGRIADKFGPVVKAKVEALGSEVVEQRLAPDDSAIIEQELKYFLDKGVDLILVTGGMSVDPDDRTPGAIRNAGSRLVRYGTPMLPGSMLLIAYHGSTAVMGLPGCVMHDPFTSFDVFLPRILAGEEIEEKDITSLGYGGFHSC
jgi:molybdenum cofactor synthesis domain-containing protein